ncbi:transmembrane protein 107-like isoform X2 [Cryptotermes secundus]|nr:transmembrane protein 107-like isoform X2 [Cryptotermes secundus]XP_023723740.1 transmembrane protein 107-like isoform X2 [Cryptotermes secundus]XP_033610949.1 transmembrane protein 107-like isoform X2 [Cryptotermes secundus]
MVFVAGGLIPARFLTLISHLTIVIVILWSRDENVKACLPLEYTAEDYSKKDVEVQTGLGIAIMFIGIELLTFLMGITMFLPSVAMISIASHSSASVLLAYFVFDEWDCNLYWWVFAFCSVPPAIIDATAAIGILVLKKS